jgi:hypothetical protein
MLGVGIDNPCRIVFLSLRMNKCLERVNDRHLWNPGLFSYALIPICHPNSRSFFFHRHIYSLCDFLSCPISIVHDRTWSSNLLLPTLYNVQLFFMPGSVLGNSGPTSMDATPGGGILQARRHNEERVYVKRDFFDLPRITWRRRGDQFLPARVAHIVSDSIWHHYIFSWICQWWSTCLFDSSSFQ